LRQSLNQRAKAVGAQRHRATKEGVAYVLCVRPKAFEQYFYLSYPIGQPCYNPSEAPRRKEILARPRLGKGREFAVQYRGQAQLLSKRQRDVRVMRLSSLEPAREAHFEQQMRPIHLALQVYDLLHSSMQLSDRQRVASDLQATRSVQEVDLVASRWHSNKC
jgi:hypothetical protein